VTTIGHSIVITGDVTSDEELQIDGRVKGAILMRNATLIVGEPGQVDADVRGVQVHIQGRLRGSVTATERITLTATASVKASLSASQVVLIEGARFEGGIDMGAKTIAAKLAQFKAAAPA
jgi:cytoskeletal protein CcmA (bactofilin family)